MKGSYRDSIYAFLQLPNGTEWRRDFDRGDFTSIPRQGELFRLADPGSPVAVIERVLWRPGGGVELFMRPFGKVPITAKLLERWDWTEGDWWDPDVSPG